LSVLSCSVHWFNPIAWFVRREIDRACELACDEAVIHNLDAEGRQNYGETLIYVAAENKMPHAVLSTTMCEEKKALKERLGAILKSKKHTRVAVILSVVLVLVVSGTAIALGAGRADTPGEPPAITVKSGQYSIDWTVGKNKWNGAVYDRLDVFQDLMPRYRSVSNLPYVKNGELITIAINGTVPDSVTLTEHILSSNGNRKYNIDGMTYDVSFGILNRVGTFTLTPNYATGLSSFSGDYEPGNTIKGYSLICTWGNNECEYGFIIRGDAAITMTARDDVVSVTIWKDDEGKTRFTLTDNELPPTPVQLSEGRVFNDVAGLNATLAEYQQDRIATVFVKHTRDFTKEEIITLTERFVIPSGNYSMATSLYETPFLDPPPPADRVALDTNILDKIYLGMPNTEVYDLFGEPDFAASGLDWYGYNEVGTFDPEFSGTVRRISLTNGTNWVLFDLINTAVKRHNVSDAPTGEFPAHSYRVISQDANPNNITVQIRSLYETYLPNGQYDVSRIRQVYADLELSFMKNSSGEYELTSYRETSARLYSMDIDLASLERQNHEQAMYFFVGAVPSDGRFGFQRGGTAAVTDCAEYSTVDDDGFLIKYFPGATLSIEKYDEEYATYPSDSSWVIEYTDSSKNITIGRDGMDTIPITDDLIGIRCINEGRYEIRFEKYRKAE
jgi:hypothetical protein